MNGQTKAKFGFGLMRLPKVDDKIDLPQVCEMVDRFLAAGFTYFDTAFVYDGSEQAAKAALVDRHPRTSYTLATKLHVGKAASAEEARRELQISLERTGAGYFDYYLLHALMETNIEKYAEYGLWDFVKEQKARGTIRHYGFSFHDKPETLDKLLTEHPDVDFVQLQINYADWENPEVQSRACYEVARRHGKPVVIMEPVKGGALADPPAEVKALFDAAAPGVSYASWALRFAASLDGVLAVLSGMSNVAQMEDNLATMGNFAPLNDEEQKVIQQAQHLLGNSAAIACTACHYCTAGCPGNIPIPEIFAAANKQLANGQQAEAAAAYAAAVAGAGKASDCIHCRQCEQICPQHLPITRLLGRCADMFEA